jgi:hypothetical protein
MRLRGALTALLLVAALPAGAQQRWVAFSDPAQGFSAQFPGPPRENSKPVDGKFPLTAYQYQFADGSGVYNISVIAFAGGHNPNPGPAFLTVMIANYARGSGATVRTQYAITLAGRPGMEAIAEDSAHNRFHLIDVVVLGTRAYLIVSEGARGHETSPEAVQFRNSFRLG